MPTPSNNYAPPQSVVADIPAGEAGFEKASRGSRLGAVLLDGLIFSLPLVPSYLIAANALIHSRAARHANPYNAMANTAAFWTAMAGAGIMFYLGLLADVVLIVVTTVFVYRNAQTIGKRLVGIKVARTDGSRAGLARIFWLRYLLNSVLYWVPFLGGLYSLVDNLMIFGETRRCCHDHIADTIVIRA